VRPLEDLETLSAELEHFRHEGEPVEPALLVERLQDLFLALHLHPIANSKPGRVHGGPILPAHFK
jgi:hypothetical protein